MVDKMIYLRGSGAESPTTTMLLNRLSIDERENSWLVYETGQRLRP